MNGLPWCLKKVAILSKRYTCQRRGEEIVTTFKAMRGKLKKNKKQKTRQIIFKE